jgi:hypothetical protein
MKLASSMLFRCVGLLAKVHGVDVRACAALLSVCTFAACFTVEAYTLLSVFEKALARYGSCVLAARHALLTLGQGIASTPLNVFGALAWLEVVTWFSIFSML